ncbi:hypothetical protein Tco_0837701 [Tanacetum coccineum]
MDDLNITMDSYIKTWKKEKLARSMVKRLIGKTAHFGKVKNYEDEDDCFIDFKTESHAIVFDLQHTRLQPTSSEGNETTPGANGLSEINMAPLPAVDQRHPWLRYQVKGYTEGIVRRFGSEVEDGVYWRGATGVRESCLEETIRDLSTFGGIRRRMTWRQFILELGLHTEQEMERAGFDAYWDGSDRVIPDKGDLRDYWIEISSGTDFLGLAPSYVLIRDHVRRLCYKMIAYSISGRGQAPEKVTGVDLFYLCNMDRGTTNVPHILAHCLFRHAEGRTSRARLSGGHFY